MPEWLVEMAATGGPAVSVIMTYMWWQANKRADKYEDKLLATLEKNNEQAKLLREVLKGREASD